MTALNPSYTVGFQIEEVLRLHLKMSGKQARKRAIELLEKVEIPGAASNMDAYPHQLSGGMSQRVAIAMAIAGEPKLLIADEPTTALDVTIQAQIMDLLLALQKEQNMGLVLITHDLAVVAETAQRVCVMYAGQAVEVGQVPQLFDIPAHPYSEALLKAIPEHSLGASRLSTLPGIVPGRYDRPQGCLLSPRCPYVQDSCRAQRPGLDPKSHSLARCFFPLSQGGGVMAVVLTARDLTRHYEVSVACSRVMRSYARSTACRSNWKPARPSPWSANRAAANPPWPAP